MYIIVGMPAGGVSRAYKRRDAHIYMQNYNESSLKKKYEARGCCLSVVIWRHY